MWGAMAGPSQVVTGLSNTVLLEEGGCEEEAGFGP